MENTYLTEPAKHAIPAATNVMAHLVSNALITSSTTKDLAFLPAQKNTTAIVVFAMSATTLARHVPRS
jgi:hypothetical protein